MESSFLIVRCPQCGSCARLTDTWSAPAHMLTCWSDGKYEGTVRTETPFIHGCLACGLPFWLHSSEKNAEYRDRVGCPALAQVRGDPAFVPEIPMPGVDVCLRALDQGLFEVSIQERYLRIKLRHALNDPLRTGEASEIAPRFVEVYRDNLQRLRDLAGNSGDWSRFECACIARELGEWVEAGRLLAAIEVRTMRGFEGLRELVKRRESGVRRIAWPES